jgi:ABC-2 type transport system permease protein
MGLTRMHGYRAVLEKEVIEAWRTYRVVLLCALFVLLGIAAPILTRYLPELSTVLGPLDPELGIPETGVADVTDVLATVLVQAGLLAGVLLAMGAVAGERERGTAWMLLARPISRAAYVWAKLVALAMVFGLALGLSVLAAWLYTTLLFGPQPVLGWVQLAMVLWLSAMVYVAISFLGSTLSATTLGAAGFGLAAVAGFALLSIVPGLSPWLPTGLVEVAKAVVLEDASEDLDPARTVAVSTVVILGCALLSWLRFRREEA